MNLHDVLRELTRWCEQQSGAVLWTLFSTCDENMRGFQILVMNHETHEHVWHCNALELADISEHTAEWLKGQR